MIGMRNILIHHYEGTDLKDAGELLLGFGKIALV
jgi:uncharacterized protein with HEPN domain